jgi:hypothetical protein
MVGRSIMTGDVSLVNDWVYRHWEDEQTSHQQNGAGHSWWRPVWSYVRDNVRKLIHPNSRRHPFTPTSRPVTDLPFAPLSPNESPHESNGYELHTAGLALAATTVGHTIFPPLQMAGLPLLVYMGIPSAKQAYDQLADEGRAGRALSETVVLALFLVSGHFWAGAFGFWLYHGSRRLMTEKRQITDARRSEWHTPTTARLWKDDADCAVPTAALQPGDQVLLHSGDLAPADGVITEGAAWLQHCALPPTTPGVHKGVGDKVATKDLVLVGFICVRVVPTAT